MKILRNALRNFRWLYITEIISKGMTFFALVILARFVGASSYGKFNFAISFTAPFAILTDLGLSLYNIREVSKDKKKAREFFSKILGFKLLSSIIVLLIIFASIFFIEDDKETIALTVIIGIWVIVNWMNEFLRGYFRIFAKPWFEGLTKISERIFLLLSFTSLFFFDAPLLSFGVFYSLSIVFSFLIGLYLQKKFIFSPNILLDFPFIKKALSISWCFALLSFLDQIFYRSDQIMIKFFRGNFDNGIYSAAYQIIFGLMIVQQIYQRSFFPTIAKQSNDNKILIKILIYLIKIVFLVFLPIIVFIQLFSEKVIEIFFGPEFLPSSGVLKILVFSLFLITLNIIFITIQNAKNNEKKIVLLSGIAVTTNVILNSFLIPRYSYIGASFATVISQSFLLFMLMILTKKTLTKSNS